MLGPSSPAILGAVAVFVGCTIYSAIFVYISARITGLSPVRVVATQNLIGGVLVALSALLIEGRAQLPRSVDGYLAVGYLAVISSVVALTLAIWLIGTMGAPRFSLMSFVTPVIGVTVGVTWLDESLQAGMVVGGGLIAVSLTLSLRSGQRDPRPSSGDDAPDQLVAAGYARRFGAGTRIAPPSSSAARRGQFGSRRTARANMIASADPSAR